MNPEIAVQIFSDIAKISGTAMSLFIAVVIFALRDSDLARNILRNKWERFTLIIVVLYSLAMIIGSLYQMVQIDLTQPYPVDRITEAILFFGGFLFSMFVVFTSLVWEKYNALKESV